MITLVCDPPPIELSAACTAKGRNISGAEQVGPPPPALVALDDALGMILRHAKPSRIECVRLDQAGGRILAQPVVSLRAAPGCDVSAMDGYAVCDADLVGDCVVLEVVGESFAGRPPKGRLRRGSAMRIFTGAALPAGTDRVVLQENVQRDGRFVSLSAQPKGKTNIRLTGSDFCQGEVLVPAGLRLTPARVMAAAGADLAEVMVFARPVVTILPTGDELRPPGAQGADAASIPESVSFGVAELARNLGAEVSVLPHLPDELGMLQEAARHMTANSDIVVIIGGASVGERDCSRQMFDRERVQLHFSKVAMRPGKPVWFGSAGKAHVIGLPGNPAAALIAARLFLAPLIAGLSGLSPQAVLDWRLRPLADPLEPTHSLDCLLAARHRGDGVEVFANRDSSAQRAISAIEVLVRRRPHAAAAMAGDFVETLEF